MQTDGTIQSLLHLHPNDDPVAGQAAILGFSISDTTDRFSAPACDCRLTIRQNNRVLVQRPTTSEEALSDGVILVHYSFPYQGIYTITLEGKPWRSDEFQTFRLTYDERIERGALRPTSLPLETWFLLGLAAGTSVLAIYAVYRELQPSSDADV
jgi:hypothetical protein